MMKTKIGIIGTGSTVSIGTFHADALAQMKNVALTGIYNRNLERSKAFIAEHNLKYTVACTTYEELLDTVDGIIICTPSNVHTTFILKAIQAKKAILAEKPIVTTYSDCSLILEALELDPVFNMVGYVLRFSKQILELRRLIKENMGFVRKRIAKPVPVFGSFVVSSVLFQILSKARSNQEMPLTSWMDTIVTYKRGIITTFEKCTSDVY